MMTSQEEYTTDEELAPIEQAVTIQYAEAFQKLAKYNSNEDIADEIPLTKEKKVLTVKL